jgi:hypothetical protein
MKKYLLLLSIIFVGIQTSQAQNVEIKSNQPGITVKYTDGDTSWYENENFEFSVTLGKDRTKKNVYTRWILFDLGFSSYIPEETYRLEPSGVDPFELRLWKSTNVNIHLFQQRVNLIKHHVNLAYGLTFEFHKYYFTNNVRMLDNQPEVTWEFVPDADWRKSRLNYSYLTLPIMFNFETKPNRTSRSFHINVGGFGGPLLGANYKVKEDNGDKDKERGNFGLSRWRYGVRAEVGYGPVNLYMTWAANPLFDPDKDNGYELNAISFGLILIPF